MKHETIYTKYGVTDFEPEHIEKLKELLSGGDEFRVDIEVQKECANAQIYGDADSIEVRVENYMDDLCDLIDDALCANNQEVESNREWDELVKACEDADIQTVCGSAVDISRETKVDDLIKVLETLDEDAGIDLDVEWANCKAIVRDFINARRAS